MSSSRPSYTPASSPSRSSSSPSSSSWGSSSPSVSKKESAADRNTTSASNQSGESRKTRAEAETQSYPVTPISTSPSRTSSPSSTSSTRSAYEDTQVLPSGRHTTVYVDNSRGGRGFWDDYGHWILLNQLTRPNYTPAPVYNTPNYAPNYTPVDYQPRQSGSGFGSFLLFLLIIGIIALLIWYFYKRSKETKYQETTPLPIKRETFSGEITGSKDFQKWANLLVGTTLYLKDQYAIEDSMKKGRGTNGIAYTIDKKVCVSNSQGNNNWAFLWMSNSDNEQILTKIKESGNAIDTVVYSPVSDFVPGTRADMLEQNQHYIFQEPENPNEQLKNIKYTTELKSTCDGAEIVYKQKSAREQHGNATQVPQPIKNLMATIVEYKSDTDCLLPEALILETGVAHQESSQIEYFLGNPIRASELEA
jgi:hypothetical protein